MTKYEEYINLKERFYKIETALNNFKYSPIVNSSTNKGHVSLTIPIAYLNEELVEDTASLLARVVYLLHSEIAQKAKELLSDHLGLEKTRLKAQSELKEVMDEELLREVLKEELK